MKKRLNSMSVRLRMALTFSALILVAILTVISLSYRYSFSAMKENAQFYTDQLLEQCQLKIDDYVSYMKDISNIVAQNKDVISYLEAEEVNTAQNQYLRSNLFELLYSVTLSRKDISNLAILGNERYILNQGQWRINPNVKPEEQFWYRNAVKANGEAVISSSHVQNLIDNNYTYVISMSRAVKSKKTGQQLGVVLVDLNYDSIRKACNSIQLGQKGYVFIIDEEGNIVYHPQQQLIYSGLKNENNEKILSIDEGRFEQEDESGAKIYTVKRSNLSGWRVVGVVYADELVPDTTAIQSYYFVTALIFLSIALLVSYYLSHYFSKPILTLRESMKQIGEGNFDSKVNIKSHDEIGELADGYNVMIDRIKGLMDEIVEEHKLKRKIERKSLQAQINPHFLYNTLDSIIWMAEMGEDEKVIQMTSALAKLLRISISKGAEFISIAEEMNYLKSYLTIQKMRYEESISYSFDIDEDVRGFYTLKLLLQPLVENAIYHGLKNKEGGGHIHIAAYTRENAVVFEISDTGAGMAPDVVENIFNPQKREGALAKIQRKSGNSIGVSNVKERIRLYFGDDYGIFYESAVGEGTTVTVIIPMIDREDSDV